MVPFTVFPGYVLDSSVLRYEFFVLDFPSLLSSDHMVPPYHNNKNRGKERNGHEGAILPQLSKTLTTLDNPDADVRRDDFDLS
jgi:hypothetical protein